MLTCEVCGKLEQAEMAELLNWWFIQCADGFGEGLEQRDINTAEYGRIYVSFWNNSTDWSISTEEEMNDDVGDSEEEAPEITDISV